MIELTRASFQYENSDRGVLDISLSVKSGECVVLTGLSGCGKTTVTRLVNGLAPSYYPGAFSGSVRIDGKDISRLSTWEIGRLVGSVFQDPKSQFFSSELAGEVAFPCENYGLSAREIRERTDAAIEALKLSHLKDRAVDVLSSGEKQRAAIASVYAMKPKVFVCDEPTANLDAAGTRQLAQTLRQLKEQGFTLLLAEHRIDWLMGIADRFLYLRDGRIAAEYTPEDLRLLPEADILGMGLRSPHEGKCLPAPSVLDESPAVLKTAGLSKRIRKEVIFEDISLSVPEGGVTAITGQNGAGKTTLAQILCGLAKQTRGAMGYPRRGNRFLPLPAAPPRWSCPCPSFPPPKRSRRGDWRSPTPEQAPVPRRRTRGCGTCLPGRRDEKCFADIPPECRSRCRKRE